MKCFVLNSLFTVEMYFWLMPTFSNQFFLLWVISVAPFLRKLHCLLSGALGNLTLNSSELCKDLILHKAMNRSVYSQLIFYRIFILVI